MVKDFVELSVEEQINFARTLVEELNTNNIFLEVTDLEFQDVYVEDTQVVIDLSLKNPIKVSRQATWQAGTEEGAEEDPGDNAAYDTTLRDEVKKAFKALDTEFGGYHLELQLEDIEEDETVEAEIEINHLSHEDSGIGSYEFWGFKGYDSNPYVEVEGTVTKAYNCTLTLVVESK